MEKTPECHCRRKVVDYRITDILPVIKTFQTRKNNLSMLVSPFKGIMVYLEIVSKGLLMKLLQIL